MIAFNANNFAHARYVLRLKLLGALAVKTERWQGVAANTDTYELQNVAFEVPLLGNEDLHFWRGDIQPNLPWADDHFAERVGGEPLNPGEEWKRWPWSQSANTFRKEARFNHTYMERLWPKFARRTPDGRLPGPVIEMRKYPAEDPRAKFGIAQPYGDLLDFVQMLAFEPHTRQAWIPLFFPEDTGLSDGGRKPCTLGYQLMVREGKLHMWYPLRSCDFIRHFSDDCYLAVRLLLWVLDQCRKRRNQFWDAVAPGTFTMHMTSLHVFEGDMAGLRAGGDLRPSKK